MESTPQDTPSATSAVPRMTRTVAALLVLATVLANVPGIQTPLIENFALRPVATVGESRLWNVVTGGFVGKAPVESLVNIVLFVTMGRWIEASWGGRSFFVYLVTINTLSAICTNVLLLGAYVATRVGSLIFDPIATTNGICVALLLAVKQLIPEHEIGLSSVTMKANYLPLVYALVVTFVAVVQLTSVGVLIFTWSAFQCSWLYLRFFQSRNGVRGDLSDAFAYATLFPEPFRGFIAIFANVGFTIFRPLLMAGRGSESQGESEQTVPVSKGSAVDAERRRQRALRALDERLNSTAKAEDEDDNPV